MTKAIMLPDDPDLARFIEAQIDQRTGGRIHELRVDVSDGRVRVYGHTDEFNLRNANHLAVLAVWQVLGIDDPELVELHIHDAQHSGHGFDR